MRRIRNGKSQRPIFYFFPMESAVPATVWRALTTNHASAIPKAKNVAKIKHVHAWINVHLCTNNNIPINHTIVSVPNHRLRAMQPERFGVCWLDMHRHAVYSIALGAYRSARKTGSDAFRWHHAQSRKSHGSHNAQPAAKPLRNLGDCWILDGFIQLESSHRMHWVVRFPRRLFLASSRYAGHGHFLCLRMVPLSQHGLPCRMVMHFGGEVRSTWCQREPFWKNERWIRILFRGG